MYIKLFFIFLIPLLFSCSNTAIENFEDLKKIEIGMSLETAKSKMRHQPEKVETAVWDSTKYVYYYKSPAFAADYYKIIVSKKDSLVSGIDYGE
ncbi:hypothetical protein [Mesonia sp. K7]|uniref:hypothetical protein n=1 Tax=Mesonia sp. K7 TaxID=2218606 RepID=UPI000DAA637C|nr:hypothetical protein [Mesonia sp. K7]PZD78983.1 hypothetical protein DNG35_02975 [Mesonia sp. K7]